MLVWPINEQRRKILSHPSGAVFPEAGPAEWPDDSFTHRRLMDGDITLMQPVEEKKPEQEPVRAKPGN